MLENSVSKTNPTAHKGTDIARYNSDGLQYPTIICRDETFKQKY
jgi:hypothetical protein